MADGIWNVTKGVTTVSPSLINITATDNNCTDHKEQHIPNGLLYTPRGSDACRVCTCASGSPILCRTVLCAPPSHCNSIKVINAIAISFFKQVIFPICHLYGITNSIIIRVL